MTRGNVSGFNTARSLARKSLGPICIFLFLFFPAIGNAVVSYTTSAHGDTASDGDLAYGVLRDSLSSTYAQGNCGHCHEQHLAGIEGLLFSTSFDATATTNTYTAAQNVCFQCHRATGSVQSGGGISNENYSATFGGAAATTGGIMEAFNQASYHNLYDLQRYITGGPGYGESHLNFPNFPSWYNPCSGCHNVHIAKANKRSKSDPTETAISKPSDHENLWGDSGGIEVMTIYGDISAGQGYQPPLYDGSTTLLEPDGALSIATIQAGRTPNYNGFCIDCHNLDNSIYSTELERPLRGFDWETEVHGEAMAEDLGAITEMRSPYSDAKLGDYVLSCLDCHEPHGSSNEYLIRTNVNAGSVYLPLGETFWNALCGRCHASVDDLMGVHHKARDEAGWTGPTNCSLCHLEEPKQGTAGLMQPCVDCHFHGSSMESGLFKLF